MSSNNIDSTSQGTVNPPLYVSTIEIRLASGSHKVIDSIKLFKKDELLREVRKSIRAGESREEEFSQPLACDHSDRIRALVHYNVPGSKQADVTINIDLGDAESARNEEGIMLYRNAAKKIEVVVTAHKQSLPATTSQPQFRLLVIGNSGVGKSTLIHKVFGAEDLNTGAVDIEQEFTSPKNKAFVIHAGLGFETGEERNMEIMKDFITKRQAMPETKDHLHAVWLCLEIPYAGGRLLETGVENFLRCRKEILGDIQLVVVLTKVDLLDGQLELDLPDDQTLENFKSEYLEEHCIKPLHAAAGNDVTYVIVSTLDDYSESLINLLKATNDNILEYQIDEEPSTTVAMPKQTGIKEKIELSIRMGKKKNKNTLLKSVFRVHPLALKECLQSIHNDIVPIWKLNDPEKCLMGDNIIKALYADDLGNTTNSATTFPGPGGVFGYFLRKRDPKILMAYFVDLICVMKIISLLVSGGPVTSQVVTTAMKAYEEPRKSVHQSIDKFDVNMAVLPGLVCGRMWEKIEALIWRYGVADHEVENLKLKNMPTDQAVVADPSSQ